MRLIKVVNTYELIYLIFSTLFINIFNFYCFHPLGIENQFMELYLAMSSDLITLKNSYFTVIL